MPLTRANYLAPRVAFVLLGPVEEMLQELEQRGWAMMSAGMPDCDARRLRDECGLAFEQGNFRRAAVGRGGSMEVREDIRRDHLLWIEPKEASVEQKIWLARLEDLRLAINRRFFLGLFGYEGHFAIYPPGGFYKPHLDRHAGTSDRIVTVILYLNEHWQAGDGGELKLWTSPGQKAGSFELIEPRLGTLVCFMAADFWHEVLPAKHARMSITGWFRQR